MTDVFYISIVKGNVNLFACSNKNYHTGLQVIAGIVEHRISDQFSDQALLVNMLSFVTRIINSYWGTQVRHTILWIVVSLLSGFTVLNMNMMAPYRQRSFLYGTFIELNCWVVEDRYDNNLLGGQSHIKVYNYQFFMLFR